MFELRDVMIIFPKDIGYGDFFGSRFFGLRDFWVLKET
jgi:hypothetical protein